MIGGGALTRTRPAVPLANNDVWCSKDGVNWSQVTDSADWEPRIWFSSVVYRDHIWIIGGLSEKRNNLGDVWFSRDGKNWTELKSGTIWSPRHEHSAIIFKDKIWVAGGATEPLFQLNNELWSLSIPGKWKEILK